MNKKGQAQQVFIYMMAIIVVGAIMLIGYKSIGNIFDQKCKVDFVDFKGNLEEKFNLNSRYASFNEINIKVPCDYKEICFLDEGITNYDDIYSSGDNIAYKAIKQARKAGDKTNVYLVGDGISEAIMHYEGLTVGNDGTKFVCIKSKGSKFNINIEGISRGKIRVSNPTSN